MKKFILLLLIFFSICGILYAQEYDAKEICNAIFIIEGGENTNYPYGIKSIKCEGKNQCEKICLNTVKNNRKRFAIQKTEKDFLKFLQSRYCPNSEKLCENWLKNLKFYLVK